MKPNLRHRRPRPDDPPRAPPVTEPRERVHADYLEEAAFDAHGHGERPPAPDDLVGTPERAKESIAAEEPAS
jgi:hypothetical protein